MKAATAFRIGIYLLGLWWLGSGLSSALYYGHAILSEAPVEWSEVKTYASGMFGYAIVPLSLAIFCFGFAGWLSRGLLGSGAGESLISLAPAVPVVRISVRLLALYLFGMCGGPLFATVYEFVALRAGNATFTDAQVTSDLISNGVGVAFAWWLGLRTNQAIALFVSRDEIADQRSC